MLSTPTSPRISGLLVPHWLGTGSLQESFDSSLILTVCLQRLGFEGTQV